MSILAYRLKRGCQLLKTAGVYVCISVCCIAFAQAYALFEHGVTSPAMSLMFLYPLAGGTLAYTVLWLLQPAADAVPNYRAYYNLYNSGIATLTTGSLLQGVFEIAGTSSPFTIWYRVAGGLFAAMGAVGFWVHKKQYQRKHSTLI